MQTLEIDPTGWLVGTRFAVYPIVPLMLNGYTPEAMTRVYHLSVEQIQAMLRFIRARLGERYCKSEQSR